MCSLFKVNIIGHLRHYLKMPKESVAPQNRKLFPDISSKRLYPDKKEWNSKVMTELRAVIEEYEDDISLKHIGFPQDWYEQLER